MLNIYTILLINILALIDLLIILEAIYVMKYSYNLTRDVVDYLKMRKIIKERFKNV